MTLLVHSIQQKNQFLCIGLTTQLKRGGTVDVTFIVKCFACRDDWNH